MNSHWRKLEYPKILKQLARHADFSGGVALSLALEPTTDYREAQARLNLTTEARELLLAHPNLGLGGVTEIRPLVEQSRRGVVLDPSEMLQVRSTLLSAANVRRMLTRLEVQFPALADIAWHILPQRALTEAIGRVLDDRGEVRNDASAELVRIRRELRSSQERIQGKLQRLIASSAVSRYLQEAVITRREGRYVVPVQASFKNQVEGIIHDRSASGQTFFIEPLSVVALNNALRELALAEREEIRRLLRELTLQVAAVSDEIDATLAALAELSLTLAKARYAEELLATVPELLPIPKEVPAAQEDNQHPGAVLFMKGARHPLLDLETVVPVHVLLDEATHVLVITGPNTGGKTVTLKTVGLLTLMAQAGLHIPVDAGSRLSCFEAIYADIGDEQSIEQSLSTFSSHLANIMSFLEQTDRRALVLLDELGAGTDPAEGSALARALLERLRRQRCTALVATHYPELKLYAHSTPGVRNASMQFDTETLAPTFRLTIGLPGRSNAFAIARRLGVPEAVIKAAQEMLSGEELRTDDMLDDLHALRIAAARARDAEYRARQAAEAEARRLRERLAGIEEERQEILRRAEDEARAEVEQLRKELRALRQRLLFTPAEDVSALVEEVEAELAEIEPELLKPEPLVLPGRPAEKVDVAALRSGDAVRVCSLGMEGTVVGVEGQKVEVQVGAMRARVPVADIARMPRASQPEPEPVTPQRTARSASPGVQLDLRGQTVEEALPCLDRYLDDAAMAALPWVRIIHGKGTGTLRREVRNFLGQHPLVTAYETASRREGGDGATVARLVKV